MENIEILGHWSNFNLPERQKAERQNNEGEYQENRNEPLFPFGQLQLAEKRPKQQGNSENQERK